MPPAHSEVVERWPYFWTPRDRDHALYEARAGIAGIAWSCPFVALAVFFAVAAFLVPGNDWLFAALLSAVFGIVSWLSLLYFGRYATFCYWWAGIDPWWVRIEWLRPAKVSGRLVSTVDAFGRRWVGLLAVLSVVVALVALVVTLRQ